MKSLSENYQTTHVNTHETFADLVFCALVVLILFVLALTVEVSQRVRATMAAMEPVTEVAAEDLVKLTPEEMEELAKQLKRQQAEIEQLRSQMSANASRVKSQLAAMAGEQRFTGAREPAAFHLAYDYRHKLYYFIPAKDLNHADRQQSGESSLEFLARKRTELAEIALAARKRRGFSLEEAKAIYSSATQYKQVVPIGDSYRIEDDDVGIYYHILLCEFISGEVNPTVDREPEIVNAILAVAENPGPKSDEMYPKCLVNIDMKSRTVFVSGIQLSPQDFRSILLSIDGRGLMLDLEGFDGRVPDWLYDQVLAPAGYISKTPKVPSI